MKKIYFLPTSLAHAHGKGRGLMFVLILSLALAFPVYAGAGNDIYITESGEPGGQGVTGPVKVRHRVVEPPQPDDGTQPAPTRPPIRVGRPAPGGEVGNEGAVVPKQPAAPSPLWQRLEALSQTDKENAVIEVDGGGTMSPSPVNAVKDVESLWNRGRFAEAIASLRTLEEAGLEAAVVISWKQPKEVGDVPAAWTPTDVRIGTAVEILDTQLDFDAQTGNLFAVLRYNEYNEATSYTFAVYISTDAGQTWQFTFKYSNGTGISDVSAAVVDDYFYIGFVGGGTSFDQARMIRSDVSDGSYDSDYGLKTIFDKNVAITEIALVSNADYTDDRLYYYALLCDPPDHRLIYYWASDVGTTTPTWTEEATGVTNAGWGLDATWNQGQPSGYYLYASYIASDGTHPVVVLRHADLVWNAIDVFPAFTGVFYTTSIAAYNNTVICMFEHAYTEGNGIRYMASYDGGDSWDNGLIVEPGPGGNYYKPDVTCRGEQGSACVYAEDAGVFDLVWFQYKDHYGSGAWDDEVAQINEVDVYTSAPNRIEWLPPRAGGIYAYGAIYIGGPDHEAYFDRSDLKVVPTILHQDGAIWSSDWGWVTTTPPYYAGSAYARDLELVGTDYKVLHKDGAIYDSVGGWDMNTPPYYSGTAYAVDLEVVGGTETIVLHQDGALWSSDTGWLVTTPPYYAGTAYAKALEVRADTSYVILHQYGAIYDSASGWVMTTPPYYPGSAWVVDIQLDDSAYVLLHKDGAVWSSAAGWEMGTPPYYAGSNYARALELLGDDYLILHKDGAIYDSADGWNMATPPYYPGSGYARDLEVR